MVRQFATGVLFCCAGLNVFAQGAAPPVGGNSQVKVVIAPASASSDSVIAIPPEASWGGTIAMQGKPSVAKTGGGNLADWIQKVSALNGLESNNLRPWHVVIEYDQFDRDGDNVHSGVVDELWAGPKSYRISYKSDNFNQTDYATASGLFRVGDQRWPTPTERLMRTKIIDPFTNAATLDAYVTENVERKFGQHSLQCVGIEARMGMRAPIQYCFDESGKVLRYSRGKGWDQTAYNDIVMIQGRSVARDVVATDAGKPFLNLRVKVIETISNLDEKQLVPPADAVNMQGKRVTGVPPTPIQQPFPEFPDSLRREHFSVTVDVVIGKDGKVLSATAVDGLPKAYKAAEKAVMKWTFQPYLVMGEPVEMETKVQLTNN
jgi:hypothetical protein